MTVAPDLVVEHFNVIEDIHPYQIPGFVDPLYDEFFFQRAEEQFGHRIILAVATPTHARSQGIGPAKALSVITAILATLIAV